MNHFQNYLVTEFAEDYQEGRISRRQALKLIASITGSLVLANSVLAACAPVTEAQPTQTPPAAAPGDTPAMPTATETPAPSATVEPPSPTATLSAQAGTAPPSGTVGPDDPAVVAGNLTLPGQDVELMAYLARPSQGTPAPVILVCHENRGLTEHIQDVTRRLAKAGYVALAMDLLTRQGGTPSLSPDQVPGALGNSSPDQFTQDFLSGWEYLKGQSYAQTERVGMTGFCFGGGVTWLMATRMPELLAAVPFYGPHPPVADVPKIQAAVLGIYAGRDSRINGGIPAIEEAMQANGKIFEKVIYPDVDHAFHNDTGSRYAPEAAQDAWQRTLDWFARYVRDA